MPRVNKILPCSDCQIRLLDAMCKTMMQPKYYKPMPINVSFMTLLLTHNCYLSTSSLLLPKHILNHKVLYFSNKIFSPNCSTTLFHCKDAYFRWVWMPEIVFSQCSFQKSFCHHKLVYIVQWTCYDFFPACLLSLLLLTPSSAHCSPSWTSQ